MTIYDMPQSEKINHIKKILDTYILIINFKKVIFALGTTLEKNSVGMKYIQPNLWKHTSLEILLIVKNK